MKWFTNKNITLMLRECHVYLRVVLHLHSVVACDWKLLCAGFLFIVIMLNNGSRVCFKLYSRVVVLPNTLYLNNWNFQS